MLTTQRACDVKWISVLLPSNADGQFCVELSSVVDAAAQMTPHHAVDIDTF